MQIAALSNQKKLLEQRKLDLEKLKASKIKHDSLFHEVTTKKLEIAQLQSDIKALDNKPIDKLKKET
jgi:hypothetical protein